jgi:hypothetical protein
MISMPQEKDSETAPNEKTYIVRYRLPGEAGRNPRKVKVHARNQSDAKKTALATIPDAKIVGGAKEINEEILDEGVIYFAKRVGDFIKRCVGRGCLSYAGSPISSKAGAISQIRKRLTRELAANAGERLVRSGGGEPGKVKISVQKTKRKKKSKWFAPPPKKARKRKH